MESSSTPVFVIVRNIPLSYRSADLRRFFSDAVENESFSCFHFKHRPEHRPQKQQKKDVNTVSMKETSTFVCIASLRTCAQRHNFVTKYNKKYWDDKEGNMLTEKCIINLISKKNISNLTQYLTSSEKRRLGITDTKDLSVDDLFKLSELQPPSNVMPHGNVGTPVKVFLNLVRDCKLPPNIIKKLKLEFPSTASNKLYGNVGYKYQSSLSCEKPTNTENNETERDDDADSDDGEEWERHEAFHDDVTSQERCKERLFEEDIELKWEKGGSGLVFYTDAQYWKEDEGDFDEETADDWDVDVSEYYHGDGDRDAKQIQLMRKEKSKLYGNVGYKYQSSLSCEKPTNTENNETERDDDADSDDGEEWERHEAFHDDVTSQERCKERLFEEDIELKWEKGGSGLVFYTDAQYWKEDVGDFDEETADDWDVDVSEYYHGDGDRDAKQIQLMRKEKRLREGAALKSGLKLSKTKVKKMGKFEEHTRGFGRHIMEGLGWNDDVGLGRGGRRDPVEANGQVSRDGLGFKEPYRPAHRSGEPLASSSHFFPQFRSNISRISKNRRFSGRNRKQAVPGTDGIVITTIYDEPLDVDLEPGLLRSAHSGAMKRRRCLSPTIVPEPTPATTSSSISKLVNPPTRYTEELNEPPQDIKRTKQTQSLSSPMNNINLIKFVKSSDR
nr:G patch domain-containing protein 3 [Ciona intestinalis]|eukprot:XP_026694501.1 G patch domain-containing protein 3 [Ciona intestinalis]